MSTRKLVFLFVAWLFAAGAIAMTVAIVVTEILTLIGIVDRSGSSYGVSLNILTAVTFVALALVPFVFRARFVVDGDGAAEPSESTEDAG